LANLQKLYLGSTKVTDEQIAYLKTTLPSLVIYRNHLL